VSAAPVYPVHVTAVLDHPSRGLWLVKWLLVVPHYVVLAFLWLGFVVVSVLAFFAILVTGRYPAALFRYNVGVLRWSWRVTYYAYGALATDRYPPFTLEDVPDYPAHFSVDYPEHLSRGLVLVKWWLLALPHYVVVGLFVGGGTWFARRADQNWDWSWGSGGLVSVLVCISAVVLLFRGTYPRALFDVVLGMQRWALRVAGYAALMTDVYPPFRLDLGGDDPDALVLGPSTGPDGEPVTAAGPDAAGPDAAGPDAAGPDAASPGARTSWTAGRVVALVVGSFVALTAMAPLIGGTALTVADHLARDGQGYLTSPTTTLRSAGFALTSDRLLFDSGGPAWAVPARVLGTARVRVTSTDPSRPVFVGVGPASSVSRYLAGVAYSTPTDFGDGRAVAYTEHDGGAPVGTPGSQGFWTQQISGTGEQTLTWEPGAGEWAVVVMPADGRAGIVAAVDAGVTAPSITWIGGALIVAGLVGLALGIAVIVASAAARRTPPATR